MGFIVCFGKNLALLGCFEDVDVDVGMASMRMGVFNGTELFSCIIQVTTQSIPEVLFVTVLL